jgi:metal-dependent amidase/aminoacylase/carboxypeptidase family protein
VNVASAAPAAADPRPHEWRHHLHRIPEPAFKRTRRATTSRPCCERSASRWTTGFGGTGVVGSLTRGRCRPTVGLCCELLARPLVVEDAAGHPWLRHLPPVTTGQVRFHLGVVLTDAPGRILGSLCVYGS